MKMYELKWAMAVKDRETACEKLGAVHLLSHGIWAFKIAATKAETDLVYEEPIGNYAEKIRRSARALVLTEWKLVKDKAEAKDRAAEAIAETVEYAGGVLHDLELKRTRYVVLVAERDEVPPHDQQHADITYRHIWLNVKPQHASVTARSLAKEFK